ncbi:MAG: hypothetical protein ACOYEI_01965 [Acetivibrionales bacterium]|jgi:tetratricopeptide (TPR) repeat protein|nr:hypothetical protein [Clostridiaceae bacterium]
MLNFNVNEELSNYELIDLESVEERIGSIPDDMKHAMELYNKALDDLQSKNEDIAIIALKKAISLYPDFYEAMNLMGICYLSLNDENNARRMFRKVMKKDNNGIRASKYLARLDGEDDSSNDGVAKKPKKRKAPSAATSWIRENLQQNQGKNFFTKNIQGIIIGIILMCILWLIIPGTPINIDLGGIFSGNPDLSPQIARLEKENTELTDRLNDANEALVQANETEKKLRDEIEQYSYWSGILKDLQKLADDGKYKDVIVKIEKDLAGLSKPDAIAEEIIALEAECKPKSISQFYEAGREIYRSNANQSLEGYINAANEYIMAIRIIEESDELPSNVNAVNVYYYGGKAIALSEYPSKEEADKEALRCFEAVIDLAPHSEMASYARNRINDIENGRAIRH